MAAQGPLWLKLVLRLERAVGGPVESAVRSDAYFDVVAGVNKTAARATGAVESVSKRGWHLLNLPAGTDVRRMREQLARMDRRLVQLTKELEAIEPADPGRRLMPPQVNPADLLARANRDVERSLLRARNGLRYVRGTHRPKLGVSPKDVVWQRDKAQLWRYRGGPIRYAQPLLIVTSLVSRSYILDLLPGSSAVEFLRAQGLRRLPARLGDPGRARRGQPPRDLRRRVPAAGRRRRRAPLRLRRAVDGRLLPRRRARDALRQRPSRRARAAT